jgi:hypothetical protein
MAKKPMTAAEKQHVSRVVALGCVAGDCGRAAEAHHPRRGQGMGQRASHMDVIPLCPDHHRNGGFGVAIHAGQKTWEAKFGTEAELLELVTARMTAGFLLG